MPRVSTIVKVGPKRGGVFFPSSQRDVNRSLLFNGTDESITFNNSIGDTTADLPFSISVWIKPSSTATNFIVFSKKDSGGAGWQLGTANNTRYNFAIAGPDGLLLTSRSGAATIAAGVWQLMTMTYDGSRLNTGIVFYKNGSASALSKNNETNALTGSATNTSVFTMGTANPPASFFPGNLWNAVLFNRVITGAEHVSLFNGGVGIDPTTVPAVSGNITEWWQLGTGDTIAAGGIIGFNGNDGTPVNMTDDNLVADVP
jgi:hypothetical protein